MREKLEKFLHEKDTLKNLRKLVAAGKKSLIIDFEELLKFDMELAKNLLETPSDFLESADAILTEITKLPDMHLRVKNLDRTTNIRDIRASDVGKFIQVEGILTRASEVRPEIKEAVFKCLRCGEENKVIQVDEVFRQPLICANPNCAKKGPFKLVIENSEFRDWQTVRLQERPEELRGGRMPRQLDGVVRDDFVDKAVPGNHVVLTGTLHVLQEALRGQPRQRRRTFRKILFIDHIDVLQRGVEETELSPEDEERIKELAKDKWLRNKIIASIAPSIFGYEPVKEAIALQLFGCPAVELPDGTRIRGDSHVLLTGDPGVAKSQLLRWVSQVAPRGLFTSGAKVTGAGLTAAAVRDEIGGGWALEAGALVIADGGLASIDEFDKMSPEDRGAILEAMEQQTISVAKAGIVATLNTRTAILAAANPILGRFDRYRPLAEQINLPPLILSRFDLIFIMRDEPRVELDRNIASHMLELQRESPRIKPPKLDIDTLRKLIIYARKYINPKLEDKKVMEAIKDYYLNWRSLAEKGELPLPITPRQLEALIRLSKANARMRLSDRVTIEDAKNAMRLVTLFLREAGIDPETGKVDIDVLMTGKPRSQRQKLERVLEIIKQLESEYEGVAPIDEIKRLATTEGIRESFVTEMIEQEKMRGRLYEPKPGMVSRAVK
jgi:replicative DNA helicase Mcm